MVFVALVTAAALGGDYRAERGTVQPLHRWGIAIAVGLSLVSAGGDSMVDAKQIRYQRDGF